MYIIVAGPRDPVSTSDLVMPPLPPFPFGRLVALRFLDDGLALVCDMG